MPKHICGMGDPTPIGKSGDVNVIPYLIAPDNQVTLDPQSLVWRWHPEHMPGLASYAISFSSRKQIVRNRR
jgi:hypothetical protein